MAWNPPDKPIERMLIVMPSWVGDCVMATPFLAAVRTIPAFQNTHITAYLRPGLDDLLTGQPEIDDMIPGRPAGLLGPWSEGRRLAANPFDAAVLLPNSWRLAFTTWLARVPQRIGYGRDGRSWMLTDQVGCPVSGGWKQPFPAVKYYLNLATYLGATPTHDAPTMHLACTPEQVSQAAAIFKAEQIGEDEPVALLNPGGNNPAKRWPADRFAALAAWLATVHGMRIIVNGSPREADLVESICVEARSLIGSDRPIIALPAHRPSLGTVKAVCGRVSLVVTNDTGTRHIAAAIGMAGTTNPAKSLDKPPALVTLFGPTDPAWTTLDYPWEIELCDRNDQRIESIPIARVQDACDQMLVRDVPDST